MRTYILPLHGLKADHVEEAFLGLEETAGRTFLRSNLVVSIRSVLQEDRQSYRKNTSGAPKEKLPRAGTERTCHRMKSTSQVLIFRPDWAMQTRAS